jgi:hypothetical protein
LHEVQQLLNVFRASVVVLQVFEECDPDSPYSFQFIDPTRHQPTYGVKRSNATAALCQASAMLVGLRSTVQPAVAPAVWVLRADGAGLATGASLGAGPALQDDCVQLLQRQCGCTLDVLPGSAGLSELLAPFQRSLRQNCPEPHRSLLRNVDSRSIGHCR